MSESEETTTITWTNTIKSYFTQLEIGCMRQNGPFDLGNYSQVVTHSPSDDKDNPTISSGIYYQVKKGFMPLGGPVWNETRCDNYWNWIEAGHPE